MKFSVQSMCPGVEPTGDALVFRVQSRSHPGTFYTVDKTCYYGAGRCDCADFATRKNPKLRNGARPVAILECKHIQRVNRYQALEFSQAIIENRTNEANANKTKNGHPAHKPDQESPAC